MTDLSRSRLSCACQNYLPDHPNVIAAFGHGHTGLTAAPMTGKLVAELIAGMDVGEKIKPYLPERFL